MMYRVQVGYGYAYDFRTWSDAEKFMHMVLLHATGDKLEVRVSVISNGVETREEA